MYVCMYAYIHTYIHTYIPTYIHTHIQVIQTYIRTYVRTSIHPYIHIRIPQVKTDSYKCSLIYTTKTEGSWPIEIADLLKTLKSSPI